MLLLQMLKFTKQFPLDDGIRLHYHKTDMQLQTATYLITVGACVGNNVHQTDQKAELLPEPVMGNS